MSGRPPPTPSSFTLFPNLPFELRCLIWKTTCESRLIEVDYDSSDGFSSNVAHPTALEACQESRNAVINHYPLCFGSIFHPAKIRFNFAIDTLYMDNCIEEEMAHLFSTFRERELMSLRYLALDSYFRSDLGEDPDEDEFDPFEGVKRAVKSLVGLRELLIVFHVDNLSPRLMGCGGEHELELFDKLPKELEHPAFEIPSLSTISINNNNIEKWEVQNAQCRPIYGWRRCPDSDAIMAPNPPRGFFGDSFDSDGESDVEWAGWPIAQAFGMGMFLPEELDDGMDADTNSEMDGEQGESDGLNPDPDSEMDDIDSEFDDGEEGSEAAGLD